MPKIAETMNRRPKLVFSRTLKSPDWNNTRVVAADPVEEVRRLKAQGQDDMIIMGSGSIVAQLTEAGLIDQYEIVVVPVIVGEGRTLFEHVMHPPKLNLTESRAFANGNVFLRYETAAA
jgi:dihydrofolate reductase